MEEHFERPPKRQKQDGVSQSPEAPSTGKFTPAPRSQSSRPVSEEPQRATSKSETGSDSPAAPLLYKQPACQRCRSKKIKCDALSPQCTACKKANEACTIANPTSQQEYHRGYVESLEDRIQQLQSYMQSISRVTSLEDAGLQDDSLVATSPKTGPVRPESQGPHGPGIQRINQPKDKDDRESRFIGEGSGINFINSILAAIRTRHSDINLLRSLLSSKKKSTSKASSSKTSFSQQRSMPPNPPPRDLGLQLLRTYLEKAQPKHPFIARSEIVRVCESLLGIRNARPLSSQDHFRAYMVFAIASVWHFRQGEKDTVNPMKFYANAMFYIDGIPRLHGVDGVTNLLFIARLGFFCTTGLSLWYISNLCLRICVENEMHINPPRSKFTPSMPAFEEQIRRRLFWQCYSLDRHASQTLGRPFGIADEDIKVDLPEDVDDEKLIGVAEDLPTFMAHYKPKHTGTIKSELAFFIHNIKLKKITSRMNVALFGRFLHQPKDHIADVLAPGKMYTFFEDFVNELEEWRISAPTTLPVSAVPMSRAYVSQDWFDLHFYQEKLTLVRAIIDLIPRPTGHPPSDLLDICFVTATRIIKLYQKDSAMGDIEPARGRLYRVFVAGISVLYCLLLTQQRTRDEQTNLILPSIQNNRANDAALLQEQKEMLRTCQRTLELMAKPLIDDGSGLKYVRTYEVLCREVLRRVNTDNARSPTAIKRKLPASGGPGSGGEKMSRRQSTIEGVGEGEFGGASPPSGYEKIHAPSNGNNNGNYTNSGTPNDNSPHSSSNSWAGMSDFTVNELGEWFTGDFGNGNGGTSSGGGLDWDLTGGGPVVVENGVTGGYDYQWEGLGAEWAGFLEILMDGKTN
ncbi:putative regulator of purine utilization [Drechslerella dactyloides]|uniref:Regulator of purine utilization n=1 Tax=Drechslerella dactyloides TaxID=74499 RepID=A0AAD6NNX4_DREDA|nr:putative regulator of purine utilization [Drechslerella dactyloides]